MNDSDIDALGVGVLDRFCADLAPSHPETEEDECSILLGNIACNFKKFLRSRKIYLGDV